MPGWWNWQTQRTQNPPHFGAWGFDPPSRHQDNKEFNEDNGHSSESGHSCLVPVLVHVVLLSACARLASSGDSFDHRLPMLRG